MANTTILTLAEAKGFLNKDATADDVALQSSLNSVARVIEQQVGPIDPATYTRVVCGDGTYRLDLPHRNVTAVSSAVYVQSGAAIGADLSAGNLVIDPRGCAVYLKSGTWPDSRLLVTYVVGRTVTDSDKDAVRLGVQNYWQHKRGSARGDQGPVSPAVILTPAVLALLAPDSIPLGFA